VLRTAMLSTRANRYYGPPDGIQPEFDLLFAVRHRDDRTANCIGQFFTSLKPKSAVKLREAERYIIILVCESRPSRIFACFASRFLF
jgi:hypothetical protein